MKRVNVYNGSSVISVVADDVDYWAERGFLAKKSNDVKSNVVEPEVKEAPVRRGRKPAVKEVEE